MPRTPPLMMPTNVSPPMNWFTNNDKGRESPSAYEKLDDFNDLSPFTYSPSDDDEYMKTNKNAEGRKRGPTSSSQRNADTSDEPLFHKPTSKQNSQRTQYNDDQPNQNYELEDEDESQNGETQNFDNISNADTQSDEAQFNSAVEDIRSDFKLYTDEYKEFKRHVDNSKRELLEYIRVRTAYFEERGSDIFQKWESLRELI